MEADWERFGCAMGVPLGEVIWMGGYQSPVILLNLTDRLVRMAELIDKDIGGQG